MTSNDVIVFDDKIREKLYSGSVCADQIHADIAKMSSSIDSSIREIYGSINNDILRNLIETDDFMRMSNAMLHILRRYK